MEPQPAAPPVVVVVVAREPGPWLEEHLESLEAQDYPNLAILVVDAASTIDLTERVGAVSPRAYVRRLADNPGYGAAANQVLEVVEGATFFAFCHDDTALAPDAIRLMVEEAYRSNAGIVGPKLVDWHEPQHLLAVGLSADKSGVPAPLVDRGELDQEQHDGVRDVFATPGGCILVRADLFAAIGGFDPTIDYLGDDVDLCWRAQVAGARVIVAPDAVVRHLEALADRRPVDDRRRLQARHRLRTTLKVYGRWHLVRVMPQIVVFAVAEAILAVLTGHPAHAREVVGAFTWNAARRKDLRVARRAVQASRRIPDGELRRLQVHGSARLTAFLRGQLGLEHRVQGLASVGRGMNGALQEIPVRAAIAAWSLLVLLLVIGSRDLLGGRVPAVGSLSHLAPAGDLFGELLSGWRDVGLGAEAPAPTAFALLGALEVAAFGLLGLLRTVLVVGLIPVGWLLLWRAAKPLGALPARTAALLLYAANPLPYNALAQGSWAGLLAYAAMPWVLSRLLRASGMPPFAPDRGDGPADGRSRPGLAAEVLGFGVVLAVLGAFVPVLVLLAAFAALAVAVGSGVTRGGRVGVRRIAAVAGGGAALAAVLNVPWSLDFVLPGADWAALGGVPRSSASAVGLLDLLRFRTGPVGFAVLGWVVLLAPFLPLLVARGWRLAWAGRLWGVALATFGVAWSVDRGWMPLGLPGPEVILAPAAAALALVAGIGVLAFTGDVRGHRFGWRQVALVAMAVSLGGAVVPLAAAATDGGWRIPTRDHVRALSWLATKAKEGSFRTLWLGPPEVLPVAGWRLADGLAYGTSTDGLPDVTEQWPGSSSGATGLLADALRLAGGEQTAQLGRVLATMGVRYVVVVDDLAPNPALAVDGDAPAGRRYRVPSLLAALDGQVDLRRLAGDEGAVVYENAAWVGRRAALPASAAQAAGETGLRAAAAADLTGATPVLVGSGRSTRSSGTLPAGAHILAADASSARWELRVAGKKAEHRTAFGYVNAFVSPADGDATLSYRTAPVRYAGLALQVLLWVAALRVLRRSRRAAVEAAAR